MHTPESWYVVSDPDSSGKYAQYRIEPHICDVFYTNRTGAANARLIAAAPDLLHAAQLALEVLDSLVAHDIGAKEELRQSIAKATSA